MVLKKDRGRLVICVLTASCCYGSLAAEAKKAVPTPKPDKEILEFLAEFDGMDDDDFSLLISYAKKDSEENGEKNSETSSDTKDEDEKESGKKEEDDNE